MTSSGHFERKLAEKGLQHGPFSVYKSTNMYAHYAKKSDRKEITSNGKRKHFEFENNLYEEAISTPTKKTRKQINFKNNKSRFWENPVGGFLKKTEKEKPANSWEFLGEIGQKK